RSATPTGLGKAPTTAGRKTRRGNIRCRNGPTSAHSCAPRVSNSTDRAFAQLVEHVEPERAGKIAGRRPRMVDFGDQGVERQSARAGDCGELRPEAVFQRDRSPVAVDGDRTLAHQATVTAARGLLNRPCRRQDPCVYTAPTTPSRTTNGHPQRRD